uniref:C-type lectin domain-containing protein n=1 Tax=Acrobeloides nanus TaxID=290746 RepID=A0A914CRY2_9BILA
MTYKNWASGQPINNNDAFGLSVNLTSGKWYSIPVNSSQPYICEIPATSANHKCLLGWIYSSFTNRCYKYANANDLGIIGGGFDYKSGQATCKNFSSNADLVSIRDFNENTIVSANALNTEFSSSDKGCSHTLNMDCCVQIGLYYNGITFQWTDGTPVNFTNWDNTTYQPDPHYGPSVLLEIGGNDQPGFGFYHNTWQTGQCVLAICGMASIPDYSDY